MAVGRNVVRTWLCPIAALAIALQCSLQAHCFLITLRNPECQRDYSFLRVDRNVLLVDCCQFNFSQASMLRRKQTSVRGCVPLQLTFHFAPLCRIPASGPDPPPWLSSLDLWHASRPWRLVQRLVATGGSKRCPSRSACSYTQPSR